ncbi:MAG: restriction endonuclease subunit S [Sulfuritalea sp.]|nr:restriction endonuclease subunit S [Sulfuritalea sp.]
MTWNSVPLGKVVTFQRGYDLPHHARKRGSVPIVSSAGVTDYHNVSMVNPSGVVTGRYGTIGEIFFVTEPFWPLNTTLYVRDFHGNDPRFVYYLLHRFDFHSFSGKSGVPGVNRNDLHLESVTLPENIDEQRAIAAALSDVDALLEGLTRLIAKKRDLKQAAMQQLLTGQSRLPGFSGEWEMKRLGDLAKIQRGASPRPIDSPVWFDENSSIGWVRISDVTCSGMFLYETTQRLSVLGVKHSRPVATGSLIMSICATVGRPIITRIDVCIHDGFVVFDNLDANQLFVYYVLKWIEPDWTRHGQTGSQMNLNTGLINGTVIKLPPRAEQTAIAAVLSDMDAELSALVARRDKTRDLKQAMMQELLTGRIRLV